MIAEVPPSPQRPQPGATAPSAEGCPTSPTMYLSVARIHNFRSCRSVEVEPQPDLTVLVGENNAGKSNVIDALRLATVPLTGRRSRYFEVEDLTRGATARLRLLPSSPDSAGTSAHSTSRRLTWMTGRCR